MLMNTNLKERGRAKIHTITAQLAPALIKSQFDDPVDEAARQFTHRADCPITQKTFHKVIAEFVVQVYEKGLGARWMLSGEPLGHVIALLDEYYQGPYGNGYIAAALEANDLEEGGVDAVLNRLAEIIKDLERLKHIKAVFTVNIDPSDWHLKCEIVGILLQDYKPFLPERLSARKPWELVDEISSIMYRYICSDSALQEILSYPEGPLTAGNLFSWGPL